MAQCENLREHRGVATDKQPQSADQPDHHQVHQPN
jgi:hypothetical protein